MPSPMPQKGKFHKLWTMSQTRTFSTVLSRMGNIVGFGLLVAATLIMRKGFWPPVRTGFFCGDMSIHYPIKPESSPSNSLLLGGIVVTFVMLVLTDVLEMKPFTMDSTQKRTKRENIKRCLGRSLSSFGLYLFGLCLSVFLTELGKRFSGVLRPNFLALCRPNVTCSSEMDPFEYHINYECLGDDSSSRKSFPSGHASFIAYMAVFIFIYQENRPLSRCCVLLKPLIQIVPISIAWVTGLSRVTDHVHHPSDVLCGFILGGLVGVWACFLTLNRTCYSSETETSLPQVEKQMSMKPSQYTSVAELSNQNNSAEILVS